MSGLTSTSHTNDSLDSLDSLGEELITDYRTGRLHRLEFLRHGIALGITGLLLVSVLSGCMPGHEQAIANEGNPSTTQPVSATGVAG
jgi:hypothetical protein